MKLATTVSLLMKPWPHLLVFLEPEEAALMLVTCGNMSSCATGLTILLSVPVQTTIKCGGGGYPHKDLGTGDSLASPRGPEICS